VASKQSTIIMASAGNNEDGRYQKHRSKKKAKSQQHVVNVPAISADKTCSKISRKTEAPVQSTLSSNYDEKSPTYSDAVDDLQFHPPEGGRRVSQPLLTIAEEEETAVDPARRGSTGESRDDEDDKSAGDTMDMFEDVRLRRKDNNVQRTDDEEDDDEEEEETAMTITDQKDTEFGGYIDEDEENTEIEKDTSNGVNDKENRAGQQREHPENIENTKKLEQRERRTSNHVKVFKSDEDSRSRSSSLGGGNIGGKQSVTSSKDSHGGRHQELSSKTSTETKIDVSGERKEAWFAAVTRGDTAAVEKIYSRYRNIVNIVDEVSDDMGDDMMYQCLYRHFSTGALLLIITHIRTIPSFHKLTTRVQEKSQNLQSYFQY